MLYALCEFTNMGGELLMHLSHNLLELIFPKCGEWRFVIQTPSSFIIKGLLGVMGHGSKNLHYRYIIGTGIGALAAADTSRAHVRYAS
jgi:hypothetical protein